MPILLQNAHRARQTPSRSRAERPSGAPLELPTYEPPMHPMDEKTKKAIADLTRNSRTDSSRQHYEKHLESSKKYLTAVIAEINETLAARRNTLANLTKKRQERGEQEPDEPELSYQEYFAELETSVAELTDASEEAMRKVIDYHAELQDLPEVLKKVVEGVEAQPQQQPAQGPSRPRKERAPRRRVVGDDDDDDEAEEEDVEDEEDDNAEQQANAPPMKNIKELLETARKEKADEYATLTALQRYAQNNDYILFKRMWHEALHHDDGVPLPDPSTWFDEHGRPNKDAAATAGDDDLIIEREIIDLKCPLSLQTMKEPYSNHKCKHTFEKSAIIEFIRQSGGKAKCPVCTKVWTLLLTTVFSSRILTHHRNSGL